MISDKIATLYLLSNIFFIIGVAFLFVSFYLFKTDDYISFFKMQRGDLSSKRNTDFKKEEKKEKINVYDTSSLSSESLSTKLERIEKNNNEKIQSVPKRQSSLEQNESSAFGANDFDEGDFETTLLKSNNSDEILDDGDLETTYLYNNKMDSSSDVETLESSSNLEYADALIDRNGVEETVELKQKDDSNTSSYTNLEYNDDFYDGDDSTEDLFIVDNKSDDDYNVNYSETILDDNDGSDETQVLSKENIDLRVSNKNLRELINEWGSSATFELTDEDNFVIVHTDESISS